MPDSCNKAYLGVTRLGHGGRGTHVGREGQRCF
jgi:hypothetical protein